MEGGFAAINLTRVTWHRISVIFCTCFVSVPLWLKVNTREVCFGARNDSFGSFRMQFRGKITSMRLVHLSGNVTCDSTQPNYYSYWGCQNNDRLRTIVTDSRNSRVFPSQTDLKRFYTLHGIKSFSDKLTFYNLTIPLKVEIGQEFRVWYIEDFRNEFESNNNGKTCADVYALYVWKLYLNTQTELRILFSYCVESTSELVGTTCANYKRNFLYYPHNITVLQSQFGFFVNITFLTNDGLPNSSMIDFWLHKVTVL